MLFFVKVWSFPQHILVIYVSYNLGKDGTRKKIFFSLLETKETVEKLVILIISLQGTSYVDGSINSGQYSLLSPRNLVEVWVITLLPKFIGGIEFNFLYEKNIILGLLKCIMILFAFNHLFTLISSDASFNDICSAEILFMRQVKVLSSANKIKRKNSEQLFN